MRWLCGLSLLILIASFPLLSARNGNAASQNPRSNEHKKAATQQSKQAEPHQQQPTIPLYVFQATQSGLLEALRTIRAQEETAAKQERSQYESWHAPSVLAQFGLIIVGLFYTKYAWKQWTAIKEQARIANEALVENKKATAAAIQTVEAAKQSAELAGRALNANRPFLLIVGEILQNLEIRPPIRAPVYIQFAFKNCGKSPAIISKIHARLTVTKPPPPYTSKQTIITESFPQWDDSLDIYSSKGWLDKGENVLSEAEKSTLYRVDLDTSAQREVEAGNLAPEISAEIYTHNVLLVLHGVINYSDILQQEYATEFRGYLNLRPHAGGADRFNFEFKERAARKHDSAN
jgi:hypothetical protein